MLSFRFTLEDLSRTRFAISPMWELITGLRALRDPARAARHLPWVTATLPVARELDLEGALALTPPEGYMPDFLTPPPSDPLAAFADELEVVRSTGEDLVRHDVAILRGQGRESPKLDDFLRDPRGEVERMCGALELLWQRTLEPHWPRIRALLQDDLRYRAARMTEGGPAHLFADLSPHVRWRGDSLELAKSCACVEDVSLDGRGLLLVPSALQSTNPNVIVEEGWQPTLIYPARGTGLLWEPDAECEPEALKRLIGGTRSQLLVALAKPRSTTDLSQALGVSAGGVSQHLSVLRDSGLVCSQREGRSVLYMRTELAESLIA